MTAREELLQLIGDLTEEEAAACVKAIAEKREPTKKWHDPREDEWIRPGKSKEGILAFLAKVEESGPTMSEEEWSEFARSFDSHRPHRPVFT